MTRFRIQTIPPSNSFEQARRGSTSCNNLGNTATDANRCAGRSAFNQLTISICVLTSPSVKIFGGRRIVETEINIEEKTGVVFEHSLVCQTRYNHENSISGSDQLPINRYLFPRVLAVPRAQNL